MDGIRRFEHVKSARSGRMGRLTLDRPAKLNALNLEMVRDMARELEAWERDPEIEFVIIDGSGGGLSAGGDIKRLYESVRARDGWAQTFWTEEYRLNEKIANFPKPVVVLMAGTVMGGGVGLSAHARHRIVTDTTRLAMPEAAIGLIPDVGATWLLSRAPGETGTYVALTGTHVGAADAILLGLAEHFVPVDALEPLVAALARESPSGDAEVEAIVRRFATAPQAAPLDEFRPLIDRAFAYDTVEEILAALLRDGSEFALSSARRIAANSPTSVKLALRALRESRGFARLQDSLRLEYRLVTHMLHGHDFREGVRAAVIDKDRAPKWSPAQLSEVSSSLLDARSASLGDDELQL